MTLPRKRFTVEDYMQLPEDQRYELLEGELVMTPAPGTEHQEILLELAVLLRAFVREQKLGKLFVAPTDVFLSATSVPQPDLLFVAGDRLSIVDAKGVQGAPDLVIEILSPSNLKRDLEEKRQIYSTYGVHEYWIVDPEAKSVAILTQQGAGLEIWQRFSASATLTSPLLPDLQIELAQIFAV